jgi:hypothetical protein
MTRSLSLLLALDGWYSYIDKSPVFGFSEFSLCSFTDLIALIHLFAAPVSPAQPDIQEEDHDYDPPDYHQELSPEEEEYARNSAAAREVAREMDALQFSPPGPLPLSQQQQPYQQSIALQPTRPLSIGRSPSPLSPPVAPFAQPRSVSPSAGVGGPSLPYPESPRVGPGAASPPISSDTSYSTPPEYPAPSSSSASVTTSSAGGPRMISAAAFKRTGRSGSDVDVSKKRPLPSSPYPVRTASSGVAHNSSQDNLGSGRPGYGAQAPDHTAPREPGSPVMSDYGVLGNVRVTNSDGAPSSPGYSQNHFVTNLED